MHTLTGHIRVIYLSSPRINVRMSEFMNFKNPAIGLTATAAIVAALWIAYSNYSSTDFAALNAAEWKPVQVGVPFIQFETPVDLKDESRPPLGDERQFIKRYQQHTYQSGKDVRIIATIVDYLPHVYIEPNAVELSVRNFDKQFGARDINFQINDVILSTYKAKLAEGTFVLGSTKYIFTRINVEYRNNYRDILVFVKEGDPEADRFRRRVLSTVQFQLL
jgi:hypothetical protein